MLVTHNLHHLLPLLGQNFFDISLAIQIREPIEIVRDQMMVGTSLAGDYDDAAIVGHL